MDSGKKKLANDQCFDSFIGEWTGKYFRGKEQHNKLRWQWDYKNFLEDLILHLFVCKDQSILTVNSETNGPVFKLVIIILKIKSCYLVRKSFSES